jgi:Fic family protein
MNPDQPTEDHVPAEGTVRATSGGEEIEVHKMNEIQPAESAHRDNESVTEKVREASRSLRDLIDALARKTKQTAQQKTQELKEAAKDDRLLEQDSKEIQNLGRLLDDLTANFDDTLDHVTRSSFPYEQQEKMLVGYRKVLEEELNVINARLALAKRMAPITARLRNQQDAELSAGPASDTAA